MAPAGSYEALQAAVQAGADAVYFGVGQLNMRSKSAANFTPDDLERIVGIARAAGVKSYLTVNTVIYEDELRQMHALVDRARAAGVDAVIASDLSAILYARRIGMEVHISTQCNLTNSEAVKFFSQWADVVVLARELSLDQIGRIARAIDEQQICGPSGDPVRIEMFAHGALCMAVSGKCYLSLHETGCSANRGACRQICRRKYTLTDVETGAQLAAEGQYLLSPKDLCTIDFLDRFVGAGVRVLKIEGRARGAEYVKRVVACYDRALRAMETGEYTPELAAALKEKLATVFNRGFWQGYYAGAPMAEHSVGHAPQGLRGAGDQLLQEAVGGRGMGRGVARAARRRALLPGADDGRGRTDGRPLCGQCSCPGGRARGLLFAENPFARAARRPALPHGAGRRLEFAARLIRRTPFAGKTKRNVKITKSFDTKMETTKPTLAAVQPDAARATLFRNVYLWMTMALALTALTAYTVAGSETLLQAIFSSRFVFLGLIVAELVLVFVLAANIMRMSFLTATLMFIAYSVVNGATLSTIFLVYDLGSIGLTFLVTAGMFGAMSLYGFVTGRDLSSWGNLLTMALVGVILASVVNLFLRSEMLMWIVTYVGILLFVGLTAYDTQTIKRMIYSGAEVDEPMQKMALLGALSLYLDFINLFLYMLRLLGNRR